MIKVKRTGNFQKKFESMTPAERRVAIAKDVIKQLDARKYNAKAGTYVLLSGYNEHNNSYKEIKFDKVIKEAHSCIVCALGAACLSAIRLFDGVVTDGNRYGIPTAYGYNNISAVLKDYFTPLQLGYIESAFEGDYMFEGKYIVAGIKCSYNSDKLNDAINFCDINLSDEGRMRSIMKNIIKNKGTFIPLKKN